MRLPRRTLTLPRRPRLHWAAAAALLAASALQLLAAPRHDLGREPIALLTTMLGAIGVLAVARFATAGCFESRIAMNLIAMAGVLGVVLAHTVGAPGFPPSPWEVRDGILIALAITTVAALWLSPRTTPTA
ncbi:MAG TPA: hypothetical protein VFY91_14735 [Microbacterium sp.]|nr:hypothetical protein [Microbacterium sp.]